MDTKEKSRQGSGKSKPTAQVKKKTASAARPKTATGQTAVKKKAAARPQTLMDIAQIKLDSKHYSKDDMTKRVNDVMEKVGVTNLQNHLIRQLSGGQKKKVSVFRFFCRPTSEASP